MNKKISILGLFIAFSAILLNSCKKNDSDTVNYEESVVVANRGAGSISFIDPNSNMVTRTLSIAGSEPMYVVYVAANDRLYVGDRAGKKVHIVNPNSKVVESAITVGNGVFHMWADGQGKQLWVNNDVDNTISVIDLKTNTVTNTIKLDMKPHDVFLTKDGTKAYVSILNSVATSPDKIYMYSTSNFTKTAEVNVGKDPHLYHLSNSNKLFVPCQSGQVYTLNGDNLSVSSNNAFVGAHAIFPAPNQNTVFVTNISGAQLYSINASTNAQNGNALASISATPHNLVVNEAGNKLFVTHSGATASTVSTYTVNGTTLSAGSSIATATNPFGIAYYKRKI